MTAKALLTFLFCLPFMHAVAQQQPDDYWKRWIADAERGVPKYAALCRIWKKTDQVSHPELSEADLTIVRYWLTHQPDHAPGALFDGNYPRMAAITAGNVRDSKSYETLEKLYLDSKQPGEMVREEAFRALVKIDPDRSAKYVIKELSSGEGSFAIYADIVLREAYQTSFEAMKTNMDKRFPHGVD